MKVLAVASAGGHWIELLRILPALKDKEVFFISTKSSLSSMVEGYRFYSMGDYNRKNIFRAFLTLPKIVRVVAKENPNLLISTGAAPGLVVLAIGKLFGKKTIWIDSIASVEKLSLSGRIASFFVSRLYTQWEDLATKNIIYKGNILL